MRGRKPAGSLLKVGRIVRRRGTKNFLSQGVFERYGGNPLAIKIVASAIKDFLAGDISSCLQFLEQDLFIQDQLRDLLKEQFGRLTPLSHDKTIKLWDVRSGECLKTLKRDSSEVWAIATARDGRILASGSADGAMALWEIETGERLRTMRTPRLYEGMNIMGVTGVTDAEKSTLKAGN